MVNYDDLYCKFRTIILEQENSFFGIDLINEIIEKGLLVNRSIDEAKELGYFDVFFKALNDLFKEGLIVNCEEKFINKDGKEIIVYPFVVQNNIKDHSNIKTF